MTKFVIKSVSCAFAVALLGACAFDGMMPMQTTNDPHPELGWDVRKTRAKGAELSPPISYNDVYKDGDKKPCPNDLKSLRVCTK